MKRIFLKYCITLICFGAALPLSAKILHEERSLYSTIVVTQTGNTRCLQFDVRSEQRSQSCIDVRRPKQMVFSYTRMSITSVLFAEAPKNILVIGLGGGTLPTAFHALLPQARIDVVEIDPAVISVAKSFFNFQPTSNLIVHAQDARVWTKRALLGPTRYDIIVLDAFNGEYIPEHLMTQEYLTETKSLLTPTGVLLANTFTGSNLYHNESTTYAKVFGPFINFRIPESANRMIVAPNIKPTDRQLKARAAVWSDRLQPYGVPIVRFARLLTKQRREKPDWRQNARVLTDQYAPANLLQSGDE